MPNRRQPTAVDDEMCDNSDPFASRTTHRRPECNKRNHKYSSYDWSSSDVSNFGCILITTDSNLGSSLITVYQYFSIYVNTVNYYRMQELCNANKLSVQHCYKLAFCHVRKSLPHQ